MPQYNEIDALMGLGMQPDPRQMIDSLRGQAKAGDLMGLSTVNQISRAGLNDSKYARDAASQAGVLDQKREESALKRAAAKARADKEKLPPTYKDSLPSPYRNPTTGEVASIRYNFNTKQYEKVQGGEPVDLRAWKRDNSDKTYENVPEARLEQIDKMVTEYGAVRELVETFDPDFAAKPDSLPFEQQARVWLSTMIPTLDKSSEQDMNAAADWWRNKSKFLDLVDRHELFGGALTKSEIKSWARANISPNNTPAQVREAMNKLLTKVRSRIDRSKVGFKAAGYDPQYVPSLYDAPLEEIDSLYRKEKTITRDLLSDMGSSEDEAIANGYRVVD